MPADWNLVVGPNADGWTLSIITADEHYPGDDLVISLTGPNCTFVCATPCVEIQREAFSDALEHLVKTLSGSAVLQADYADLSVKRLAATGQLSWEGRLTILAFGQTPVGNASLELSLMFDPITVQNAMSNSHFSQT